MKSYNRYVSLTILLALIFTACKKVEDPIVTHADIFDVWVVNEGAFQAGNASLTLYSRTKDSSYQNPFYTVNGASIGDVAQAAYFIKDECWVVVNNSNSIVVLDTASFRIKKQITGLSSPRYADHDDKYLYLGSLYSSDIYRISLDTKEIETYSAPYSSIEKVLVQDDKLYLACADSACSEILVYDPQTMTPIEQYDIAPARNPYDLAMVQGSLYVLSGSSWKGIPTGLSKIENGQASTNMMTSGEYKSLQEYNGELYVLANDYAASGGPNGVYRIDRQAMDIAGNPIIPAASGVSTYYAFGIDPEDGHFYLSDAKSYTVNGDGYRFSSDGTLISKFDLGLIPSFFAFK